MARISVIPFVKAHPLLSVITVLLFGSGVFLLAYLPIRYSGAYRAAKEVVMESPFVRSMVGPNPKVTLDWWGENREVLILGGSGQSTANMRLSIHGDYGRIHLRLHMEKIAGLWKVRSTFYSGREISLLSPSGNYVRRP